LFFVVLFVAFAVAYPFDRVLHTYFAFTALPLTVSDATAQGWSAMDGICDTNLGVQYAQSGGPSRTTPISLYFTAGGQFAGFGITVNGAPPAPISSFWWLQSDGRYQLYVSTRLAASKIMCDGTSSQDAVGNVVVLNQPGPAVVIPLTDTVASDMGWTNGSCLPKMGRHWSWDVSGSNTWNWQTLLPVMPMYMNGSLVTILINTAQWTVPYPVGDFEGPFVNSLMCLNWCSSNCNFNADIWSTMHFFFSDPNFNNCPSRC